VEHPASVGLFGVGVEEVGGMSDDKEIREKFMEYNQFSQIVKEK